MGIFQKPKRREIENFAANALDQTIGHSGHLAGQPFDAAFDELVGKLDDYAKRYSLGMWGRSILCGTVDQFLSYYMTPDVRQGLIDKIRRHLLT